MTSEKPPSGTPGGRRRRPPTIDLRATEVAQPEPADPRAEPAPSEPPAAEPPPPPEPPPERRPFAFLPDELSWSHASAGIAGGASILLLLWLAGAFSSGRAPSNDLNPRLAAIEAQLRDLAARPAPASVDPKAVEDIAARLARLESAQAQPRAPVTDPVVLGRLSAAENAMKSLADNVAGLSRRGDAIEAALTRRSDATEAALRETQGRLDKLTASLADVQTTARAAAAGSDRVGRLAVASAVLRDTVERGDPFAAELAVAKPLASDAKVLAPLEPFASTGVPGAAALAKELTALLQPMLRAAGEPPRDGGFIERLQANAEKLVRIRPVEEARGDDRGAILARIEQRAARTDIPGALAEIAKLPADARAQLAAWIAKAQARGQAIDAGRRFAADAIAALKAAP